MSGKQAEETDIPALTGLRAVAAITIVVAHLSSLEVPFIYFGTISAIGMPLFFTLSGFVIHLAYAQHFARNGAGAISSFAIARFARLYPLYWFLLLVAMCTTPMGDRLLTWDGIPILFVYLIGATTWWPFTVDGNLLAHWYYAISWSISTEVFFYICYAAGLWRIFFLRSALQCTIALLSFLLAAFAVMAFAFLTRDFWEPGLVMLNNELPSRTVAFNNSGYRWLMYLSPYCQLPSFIAGVLTCQLYLTTAGRSCSASLLSWTAVFGMVGLLVLLTWLGLRVSWLTDSSPAAYFVTLHLNMLFVPICCLIIFALAAERSNVRQVLSSPPFLFLGTISYSIYLAHINARDFVTAFLPNLAGGAQLLLTVGVVIALSWLLYKSVEMPAKRVLRNLSEGLMKRSRRIRAYPV